MAAAPLGTLRIDAEPRIWVRIGGSAWHRSPIEAQLVEPGGSIELRSDDGQPQRATFRVEGGRIQVEPETRGLAVDSRGLRDAPRPFRLDGPPAVRGTLRWSSSGPRKIAPGG
jgi:hypothetical protein